MSMNFNGKVTFTVCLGGILFNLLTRSDSTMTSVVDGDQAIHSVVYVTTPNEEVAKNIARCGLFSKQFSSYCIYFILFGTSVHVQGASYSKASSMC